MEPIDSPSDSGLHPDDFEVSSDMSAVGSTGEAVSREGAPGEGAPSEGAPSEGAPSEGASGGLSSGEHGAGEDCSGVYGAGEGGTTSDPLRDARAYAERHHASRGTRIQVLIADDQEYVRKGFRLILSTYPNMQVVGEAANGMEAVEQVRRIHPDVVLMDIRMPLLSGIDATADIVGNPDTATTAVLILTTFDIDEYVYDALAAGASGFLLKNVEADDLVRAIEIVHAGDALIQPSITRRLVERFAVGRRSARFGSASVNTLTAREREILTMIARGYDNTEIADELVISPETVRTHVGRIREKLGAHDRAQLVVAAYESGLVSPSSF